MQSQGYSHRPPPQPAPLPLHLSPRRWFVRGPSQGEQENTKSCTCLQRREGTPCQATLPLDSAVATRGDAQSETDLFFSILHSQDQLWREPPDLLCKVFSVLKRTELNPSSYAGQASFCWSWDGKSPDPGEGRRWAREMDLSAFT